MSETTPTPSDEDVVAWHREWRLEREQRVRQMRRDARSLFPAMDGVVDGT